MSGVRVGLPLPAACWVAHENPHVDVFPRLRPVVPQKHLGVGVPCGGHCVDGSVEGAEGRTVVSAVRTDLAKAASLHDPLPRTDYLAAGHKGRVVEPAALSDMRKEASQCALACVGTGLHG